MPRLEYEYDTVDDGLYDIIEKILEQERKGETITITIGDWKSVTEIKTH